jgi:hypothetical protein
MTALGIAGVAALAGLTLSFPVSAWAQAGKSTVTAEQAARGTLGKRVWVTTTDGQQKTGVATAVALDQFEINGKSGLDRIPLTNIRRIDVAKSRTSGVALGAVLLGGAGVALGTLIAATSNGTSGGGDIALAGAGLGAFGGLIGYAMSSGRTEVYRRRGPETTVTLLHVPRGGGLTLRLRW